MKKELKKDDFAKWIFAKGLNIEMYNFDLIYDISNIDRLNKECIKKETHLNGGVFPSKEPLINILYLFTRDTGCDLVEPDSSIFDTHMKNNTNAYEMKFFLNNDYFGINTPYVTIIKIK